MREHQRRLSVFEAIPGTGSIVSAYSANKCRSAELKTKDKLPLYRDLSVDISSVSLLSERKAVASLHRKEK